MNRRARIAVIGCGSWSNEAHLPSLTANADAEVIALVDPVAEAREATARRFGVTSTFASHEEMFAAVQPDGVIVATPHSHHYAPARAALEAGAHLLLEKPMVLKPQQAKELQSFAAERKLELIVDYPYHYNTQSIQLRQAIADKLGRIEFVSCLFASLVREYYRGDTEAYQPEFKLARAPRSNTYSDPSLSGGGQGQTQVTHSAALVFWLTGLKPSRVAAWTENDDLPVDLVDAAAIKFEGGAIGTISSTGDRPTGHDDVLHLHISGTSGLAIYQVSEGIARLHLHGGKVEDIPGPPASERYPQLRPAGNLVDIVLGRGGNQSPAEIGVRVVGFLDAMYRSAAAAGAPQLVLA